MKKRLAILFVCIFAIGFASSLNAPTLPPLSGADRADVVHALRFYSALNVKWAEWYAYTEAENAYWLGRAEGFEAAASLLEHYLPRAAATQGNTVDD